MRATFIYLPAWLQVFAYLLLGGTGRDPVYLSTQCQVGTVRSHRVSLDI